MRRFEHEPCHDNVWYEEKYTKAWMYYDFQIIEELKGATWNLILKFKINIYWNLYKFVFSKL